MAHRKGTVYGTSVRIPLDILEQATARAQALGVSRGKYIVDLMRDDLKRSSRVTKKRPDADSVFS